MINDDLDLIIQDPRNLSKSQRENFIFELKRKEMTFYEKLDPLEYTREEREEAHKEIERIKERISQIEDFDRKISERNIKYFIIIFIAISALMGFLDIKI